MIELVFDTGGFPVPLPPATSPVGGAPGGGRMPLAAVLVHEGGYTVELGDDGHPRFLRPDGTVDPATTTAIDPDHGGLERRNREYGIEIGADTITTNWCGDPLDIGIATDNVMWDRQRRRRGGCPTRESR